MNKEFLSQIDELLARRMGVLEENIQHKLDLLVEGQQMLSEKLEANREALKTDIAKVDHRVTTVAADLSEHRRDTEAHRRGWRVQED